MPGNQQAYQRAMNEGHSAAWDQNWTLAAEHYRHALEEFPDDIQALSSLGLALYELQEFPEALKIYQRLATLNPEDPLPHEKMARIHERTGRLREAVRAGLQAADLFLKQRDAEKSIYNLIRVLSLQPENLTAHGRLALIYERLGRKVEAVESYLAMASLLQQSNDLNKAIQVVQHALELLPGSPEATQALQMLHNGQPLPKPTRPRGGTGPVRLAEILQAETPDQSQQSLDPISEARQQALVQLATLLFEQAENTPEASASSMPRRGLSALTRGTGSLPTNQAELTRILMHLNQAIESQTHGNDQQALQELERAEGLGLKHPALYYDMGLLLAERNPTRALQYLYRAAAHPEFAQAAFLLIGRVASKLGNDAEAAIAYLQALRLADSKTVPLHQAEGLLQAYEPLLEAQRNEKDPKKHKALCETLEKLLSQPDWLEVLRKVRSQLPPQPENHPPLPLAETLLESRSTQVIEAIGQIRALAAQNKIYSAMEEAFWALSFAPTYLPLHIEIGDLLFKKGMTAEALTKYRLVARLYQLRSEANQAIDLLQRTTQIAPMELPVRQQLIELLLAQGRIDEAVQEITAMAEIQYHLAELDMARQTYLEALRQAQQSPNYRQWAIRILAKVADIDQQRLEWRQALRTLEQLRTLLPDNRDIRMQMIDLCFRFGQDAAAVNELENYLHYLQSVNRVDEAIQFIQDLIKGYPPKENILRYRLAQLYRQTQKIEQAVAELDALSESYVDSGDIEMAAKMVREIIALNPPNRAEYEYALKKLLSGLKPTS